MAREALLFWPIQETVSAQTTKWELSYGLNCLKNIDNDSYLQFCVTVRSNFYIDISYIIIFYAQLQNKYLYQFHKNIGFSLICSIHP